MYTQSTDDALVLATIDGASYLRQATVRAERDLGGEDQFVDLWRDATNRAETLYPWAFGSDNLRDLDVINLQVFSQVYAVKAQHAHGELTVYLDGATRNVFHENQQKPLGSQPATDPVGNETGTVALPVEPERGAGERTVGHGDLVAGQFVVDDLVVDEDVLRVGPGAPVDLDAEDRVARRHARVAVGRSGEARVVDRRDAVLGHAPGDRVLRERLVLAGRVRVVVEKGAVPVRSLADDRLGVRLRRLAPGQRVQTARDSGSGGPDDRREKSPP